MPLLKVMKLLVLHACHFLGLFWLSGWLFRKRLHILCYHGFQLQDECDFRPQLFISGEVFEGRLKYIAKQGFTVFPLDQALQKLRDGSLPPRALVITVDDGFKSTLSVASPLLSQFGMPATVYVTTYYMDNQVPVFRLGVQYVFWKAEKLDRDFSLLEGTFGEIAGTAPAGDGPGAMWKLIAHGDSLETEQDRQELLKLLARVLNVDVAPLYEKHLLSILSPEELRALTRHGIDIQLHTHRHRFPASDRDVARREITENRDRLAAAVGATPSHFCYPSGIFSSAQWPWLAELGIASATTCLPGLNRPDTPPYGLRRFLDSESISFIEFKAELAGFNEILRGLKKTVVREPVIPVGS